MDNLDTSYNMGSMGDNSLAVLLSTWNNISDIDCSTAATLAASEICKKKSARNTSNISHPISEYYIGAEP
jgi:hypothetical protein